MVSVDSAFLAIKNETILLRFLPELELLAVLLPLYRRDSKSLLLTVALTLTFSLRSFWSCFDLVTLTKLSVCESMLSFTFKYWSNLFLSVTHLLINFCKTLCLALVIPSSITSGDGFGVPEKKPFGFGISTLTVASNVVSALHTANAFKGNKIIIESKINLFMFKPLFKKKYNNLDLT